MCGLLLEEDEDPFLPDPDPRRLIVYFVLC